MKINHFSLLTIIYMIFYLINKIQVLILIEIYN